MFFMIMCSINKSIEMMDDENEIKNYKGIVRYIFLIVVMVFVKCFSYFAKEEITSDLLYIVDRTWENVALIIVLVVICIGKRGFGVVFCNGLKENRESLGLTELIDNEDNDNSENEALTI